MNNAVSVIVTTYNLENYISNFFDELFSQSFQDFNIIVVDDCSTDNTQKIIKEYSNVNKKINYIFNEVNSSSPAFTRNKALDSGLIDSEYIIFLDGDDSIEYNFLEKLYNNIRENNSDVSICAFDRIDDKTNHKYSTEMNNFKHSIINLPSKDYSLSFINTSLWNKLIKYSVIGDLKFKDLRGPEDTLFILELYTKIKKISFISDVLIHYKVREGSVVNASNETIKKLASYLYALKNIYEKEENKKMFDSFILSVFIHLSISMPFRVYSNRKNEIDEHINWTLNVLDKDFKEWRDNRYLSFFYALLQCNVKLISLSICRFLYKVRMFKLFLFLYHWLINKFGVDIKW